MKIIIKFDGQQVVVDTNAGTWEYANEATPDVTDLLRQRMLSGELRQAEPTQSQQCEGPEYDGARGYHRCKRDWEKDTPIGRLCQRHFAKYINDTTRIWAVFGK